VLDIRVGDCLGLLREMPAGSVRCCVTSPPYWGLRDYGTATWDGGDEACDHAPAMRAIGNSPSAKSTLTTNAGKGPLPGDKFSAGSQFGYAQECPCGARRVDAQLGLERTPEEYVARMVEVFREVRRVLADDGTLWANLGDSYAGGGFCGSEKALAGKQGSNRGSGNMIGRALDHGLKPKDLVGIPWRVAFALQADGWYLRSDIIWAKPNPMPESVTDRPTKAHEYLFLLAKSQRYYYDAWAVSEPATHAGKVVNLGEKSLSRGQAAGAGVKASGNGTADSVTVADLRNRRTVWTVPTQPFSGAHFAVMPEALVEPCVLAGSAPGDTVLDPFAGSGTVGVVALRYGRRFIGCELNAEYCQMARRRVAGPLFAEVAP